MLRRFISNIAPKGQKERGVSFHFVALFLSLLPLLVVCYHFLGKEAELSEGAMRMEALARGAEKTAQLRKKQAAQMRQYAAADPNYIQSSLERYTPLASHIETLSALVANEALSTCTAWKERLHTLREENTFRFTEIEKKTVKNLQEVVLKQDRPVEVSSDDVQKILARIEGVKVGTHLPMEGRPDLCLRTFTLKKKPDEMGSELFTVEMEVIKREGVRL